MRNVEKTINKGRNLIKGYSKMSLTCGEMQELYKRNQNGTDLFNFMGDSFYFGIVVGYRIAEKEKKNS